MVTLISVSPGSNTSPQSDKMLLLLPTLLYITILHPIITYGSVAWASSHLKTLEVVQSKALQITTKAPWCTKNLLLRQALNYNLQYIQLLLN